LGLKHLLGESLSAILSGHGFNDICKTSDILLQLFLFSVSCGLQFESRAWFSHYSCWSKWRSGTCAFLLEVDIDLLTAGKSTLLQLLAGKRLISMAGAELKVKDRDVFRDSPSGVTFLGTEW
jgi:hypothetical protein